MQINNLGYWTTKQVIFTDVPLLILLLFLIIILLIRQDKILTTYYNIKMFKNILI